MPSMVRLITRKRGREPMPKIQNVGVGGYIRDPRGTHGADSRQTNIQILFVAKNDGNSFLCYPVTATNPLTLDTTRYQQIPIDTNVQQVSP